MAKRPAAAPGAPDDASQFLKFCIKFDKFYATQEEYDSHFARWKNVRSTSRSTIGVWAGRGEARPERAGGRATRRSRSWPRGVKSDFRNGGQWDRRLGGDRHFSHRSLRQRRRAGGLFAVSTRRRREGGVRSNIPSSSSSRRLVRRGRAVGGRQQALDLEVELGERLGTPSRSPWGALCRTRRGFGGESGSSRGP